MNNSSWQVAVSTVGWSWDDHPMIGHGQEGDKAEERKVERENEYPKHHCFPPNVTTTTISVVKVRMRMTMVVMMMVIPFALQAWLFLMGTVGSSAKEAATHATCWPQKFCHDVLCRFSFLKILAPNFFYLFSNVSPFPKLALVST